MNIDRATLTRIVEAAGVSIKSHPAPDEGKVFVALGERSWSFWLDGRKGSNTSDFLTDVCSIVVRTGLRL
jgi:hypothetical protein